MIQSFGIQDIATLSQATYQYNAQSLQAIYVGIPNATASEGYNYAVTVQIGNRTLVNDVSLWGLSLINGSQTGGFVADESVSPFGFAGINLGSHVCGSDTIYVTVRSNQALTATRAVQVAGLINEPVPSMPVKINQYNDSAFADVNTLQAYVFSFSDLSQSTDTIEVRNTGFSTTNPISTYVLANACRGLIDQLDFQRIGILMSSSLPLSTTFNNASSNAIITVSAMENSPQDRAVARRQASALKSSLSPSERRAL